MPPKKYPAKASTKPTTTTYRAVGPKGKSYLSTETAQQYTRTPKDGGSKSGVVWKALQTASAMPPGPKRQKAVDMLMRAYGAEQSSEATKRNKETKTYLKNEQARKIKTYNRDRMK